MREFILPFALVLAAGAHAADDTAAGPGSASGAPFKRHSLSLGVGAGPVSQVAPTEPKDGMVFVEGSYEYRLDKAFGIVGKVHFGDDYAIIGRSRTITSLQLSLKARAPISTRWSAYGRLGANVYRTRLSGSDFLSDPIPARTDKGVGLVPAAGLEFNAFNGFLLGIEAQYLPMKDLNVLGFGLAVGYSF